MIPAIPADHTSIGLCQASLRGSGSGQGSYEPSIASSNSSRFSVFSDVSSAQSSIASSISDDFRLSQDELRDRASSLAYSQQQEQAKAAVERSQYECVLRGAQTGTASYADVTSIIQAQRQNPRRCSSSRYTTPPSLVRQCERKVNFVENLVDSATQMVETIWPMSAPHCPAEVNNSGRGVLPLRTYIEETLRRSRTSYSTLQVALYYMVLIKPHVPNLDFTKPRDTECASSRALMCGRRMFLAALILASKYLQDRNYSAKAWSKMSGLKVCEINTNERSFLEKVNWKLHIPESVFKHWTEIVLRYTPNMPPPSAGHGIATWKSIIPLLTPDLEHVPMSTSNVATPAVDAELRATASIDLTSPSTTPTPATCALNRPRFSNAESSSETTPTPLAALPRFLEPMLDLAPPTPGLARMGPLPTPAMTPSSVAASTPAASTYSDTSRRASMSCAMAMAQRAGVNRCTMDQHPSMHQLAMFGGRRPSVSTTSAMSSPDSLISDRSRSSRASSISSVSALSCTSSSAPGRACLARQATCRGVRLPIPAAVMEGVEGTSEKPIVINDEIDLTSSPEIIDFTVSEKVLHAPHRHSKHAPVPTSAPPTEKSRKRGRPRGARRSDFQAEVRILLEEELDVMMDLNDDFEASPSPAAEHATSLLSRPASFLPSKESQPLTLLSRRESSRIPVQKYEGKKRTCCSTT